MNYQTLIPDLNRARCCNNNKQRVNRVRGRLSRVNGTIKMQQALNIWSTQKALHFQTCYSLLWNCGHRKAAADARTQVQQSPSNKKWFHCLALSLWCPASLSLSCASFWTRQPASHHRGSLTVSLTRGGQVQSVSRGRGGAEGEVNWTLKKDWTGDKNKIRSPA